MAGTIYYVEPNNLMNESMDNIPYNQEDYSIAVDLQVAVPNRNNCGYDVGDNVVYSLSVIGKNNDEDFTNINGGETSFMGGVNMTKDGNQSMLTTLYTEASYDNPNPNLIKEGLGISSIDIDFNAQFYPIVTIKFIDVRGISLLMPEEMAFREGIVNGEDVSKSYGSFFKSLFTFPYPIFSLRIKGFYGEPVTLKLAVSTFNAEFNSEEGNFEITTTFIGYMYGVLNDIPMNYVISAPYDEYYGQEYWKSQEFRFGDNSDGALIPTFTQLLERVKNLNKELPQLAVNNSIILEFTNISNEISSLKDILDTYNTFISSFNTVLRGDYNTLLMGSTSNILQHSVTTRRDLHEKITNHNNNNAYNTILDTPNNDISDNKVFKPIKLFYTKANDGVRVIEKIDGYDDKLKDLKWLEPLNKDIKLINLIDNLIGDNVNYQNNPLNGGFGYLYQDNGFVNNISSLITQRENRLNELKEKLDEFQRDVSDNILGFTPSIKNIFKMTLAHIDTFMHTMYQCMHNIKASNRTLNGLGLTHTQTNVNSKIDDNVSAPPFFTYYDNNNGNNRVEKWVGYLNGGSLEEVKLVNGFLNGVTNTIKTIDEIGTAIIANKSVENAFIPTSLSDISLSENPYNHIFEGSNSTMLIDELMSHLGLRLINSFSGYNVEKSAEAIGKSEAINFFYSQDNISNDLIDKLRNDNVNSTSFINYLSNTNNTFTLDNNIPIYKFINTNNEMVGEYDYGDIHSKVGYTWVDKNDNILLPVRFSNIREIYKQIENVDNKYLINNNFYIPNDLNISGIDSENYIDNVNFSLYTDDTKFIELYNRVNANKHLTKTECSKILGNWNLFFENYQDFYIEDKISSLKLKQGFDPSIVLDISVPNEHKGVIPKSVIDIKGDEQPIFSTTYNKTYEKGDVSNMKMSEVIENFVTNKNQGTDFTISEFKFDNGTLFGHPYYYAQDSNEAKGLLFLMSLPSFSEKTLNNFIEITTWSNNGTNPKTSIERLPKSLILAIGGLLWREKKGVENKSIANYDIFKYRECKKKYASPFEIYGDTYNYEYLPFNDKKGKGLVVSSFYKQEMGDLTKINSNIFKLRPSIKRVLINLFEKWVVSYQNDGFKYIANNFELQIINNANLIPTTAKLVDGLLDIWKKYNNTNNLTQQPGNNTSIIIDGHTFTLQPTLWGFVKEYFNINIFNNYQKIGINDAFIFTNRESSYNVNNIVQLILNDIIVVYGGNKEFNINDDIKHNIQVVGSQLTLAFNSFKKNLLSIVEESNITSDNTLKIENNSNENVKLSVYNTFRDLYDTWLCSNSVEKWSVKNKDEGLYGKFIFIDSFYYDIGDDLMINMDKLSDLLLSFTEGKIESLTAYMFMGYLCQENNLLFLSLPIFNNWSNLDQVKNIFKPIPYNDNLTPNEGHSYICMYNYAPSHNLPIESVNNDYGYANDGFNIADANGSIVEFTDEVKIAGNSNYAIPSFAVSYSKQNQSFFTSVKVGMENSQITGESLYNTQYLAQKHGAPNREITFSGQDLYPIYANRYYTCTVTMLGCAQILPLMYFQLNNIPLFKGVYQIIKVSHSISQGEMKTTFTGQRLNKNKIPFNKDVFNVNSLIEMAGDSISQDRIESIVVNEIPDKDISLDIPSNINISNGIDLSYEEISQLKDNNGKDLIIFEMSNPKYAYDNLESHMKQLLHSIALTTKENNCNFKVRVTSMARDGQNNKSDHNIGVNGVNSNNITSRRISNEMYKSCAIDIHGCTLDYEKNEGGYKRCEYSPELFDIIATQYHNNIRQLIWENGGADTLGNNIIDNCIHLSSYGFGHDKKTNDVLQIYESIDANGRIIDIKDKINFTPLSPKFLRTCYNLIEYSNLTKDNLPNFRNIYTTDFLINIKNINT